MEHSKEPKWYVLHTFSGYEYVAKENLENVVKKFNLENRILTLLSQKKMLSKKKWQEKACYKKKYALLYSHKDDLWR